MRHRLLAATALATAALAASVASAATLDPAVGGLGAGAAAVAPCDRDGVDVTVDLAWRGHFRAVQVDVRGLDDQCVGRSLQLVLIVAGTPLELAPVRIPAGRADDNKVEVEIPADVHPGDLERIHVAIS
jgi:hypothetical protein